MNERLNKRVVVSPGPPPPVPSEERTSRYRGRSRGATGRPRPSERTRLGQTPRAAPNGPTKVDKWQQGDLPSGVTHRDPE